MIILHAGIKLWAHDHRDNGLLLWGERPVNEGGSSPARRGRRRIPGGPAPGEAAPKGRAQAAYPYGAGLEELVSALGAAGVSWNFGNRKAGNTRSQEVTD